MGIKVYQFDPSVNPAGWPPLSSSTGVVTITNDGLDPVLIGETSWSSPGTVSTGFVLMPGDTRDFPSDDGSSGTRMGYTVSSLPGIQGSSHLTVIANGG